MMTEPTSSDTSAGPERTISKQAAGSAAREPPASKQTRGAEEPSSSQHTVETVGAEPPSTKDAGETAERAGAEHSDETLAIEQATREPSAWTDEREPSAERLVRSLPEEPAQPLRPQLPVPGDRNETPEGEPSSAEQLGEDLGPEPPVPQATTSETPDLIQLPPEHAAAAQGLEPPQRDATRPLETVPAPALPPAQDQTKAAGASWLPATCLGLLVLGIGLISYWWLADYTPTTRETRSRIETLASQLGEVRGHVSELDALRGPVSHLDALKGKIDALSDRDAQLAAGVEERQREQQALGESLNHLALRTPQGAEDWILAEVEYLLLAADQRLHLERDVKTGLAAMRAADQRLRDLARPKLKPVREHLIKDMNELLAVAPVDLTGLSLYLADLIARVDRLPFKGGAMAEKPTPIRETPEITINNWRDLVWAMWRDITRLVSITEQQIKDPALFDPEFRYYLQQHLRLELAGARLDVLRRDSDDLRASIGIIRDLLARYYDTDAEAVANVIETLQQMQTKPLDPPLPDLDQTLQALRDYVTEQHIAGDMGRSGEHRTRESSAAQPHSESKRSDAQPDASTGPKSQGAPPPSTPSQTNESRPPEAPQP